MKNTYNGWTNRETWLVNLYFGDSFLLLIQKELEDAESSLSEAKQVIEEDTFPDEQNKKEYIGDTIEEIAEKCQQFFDERIYADLSGLSAFISDYLDLSLIYWYDLAKGVYSELF